MLEVKDLHVNYGAVHALNGISLHVDDGEIVSLIGANGAGKTTPLRTITGLEKAASGSVMFDGHDLRKAEPSKIITYKLAHVPEGRHIFPQMTVEENLEMGAYADPAGMEETMKDVYKRFPRLEERRRQLAGTLSGGESFKTALALALSLADVVQMYAGGVVIDTMFIDEGFGSLDAESLDSAVEALLSLGNDGRLVGIISHLPQLKEQIPSQIQVKTGRNGSTIQILP